MVYGLFNTNNSVVGMENLYYPIKMTILDDFQKILTIFDDNIGRLYSAIFVISKTFDDFDDF